MRDVRRPAARDKTLNIDVLLTEFMVGYRRQASVAEVAFPVVEVQVEWYFEAAKKIALKYGVRASVSEIAALIQGEWLASERERQAMGWREYKAMMELDARRDAKREQEREQEEALVGTTESVRSIRLVEP